jgi:transcriptional regulator with XRE-family HTH domain
MIRPHAGNLRKARKNTTHGLDFVASIVGVDEGTILKWESGDEYVTLKQLIRLGELLHVSIEYLLGETEDPIPLLNVPNVLESVPVSFRRGEFEDLEQDEVDRLAEYAEFLKSQRPK